MSLIFLREYAVIQIASGMEAVVLLCQARERLPT